MLAHCPKQQKSQTPAAIELESFYACCFACFDLNFDGTIYAGTERLPVGPWYGWWAQHPTCHVVAQLRDLAARALNQKSFIRHVVYFGFGFLLGDEHTVKMQVVQVGVCAAWAHHQVCVRVTARISLSVWKLLQITAVSKDSARRSVNCFSLLNAPAKVGVSRSHPHSQNCATSPRMAPSLPWSIPCIISA